MVDMSSSASWIIEATDPMIRDHEVLGRHILPGLAYIDLLFHFAQERGLDWRRLELRNLVIHAPLEVPARGGVVLEAAATARSSASWRVILTARPQLGGLDAATFQCAAAELVCAEPADFGPDIPSAALDLTSLDHRDFESVYAACRQGGLRHGAFMRADGELTAGADAIQVRCRLGSEARAQAGGALFHPVLLDAALTCGGFGMSVWSHGDADRRLELPMVCKSFRASALLQEACVAVIRKDSVRTSDQLTSYCIDFLDASCRKIAELVDFSSKRVRDAQAFATQNPISGGVTAPAERASPGAVTPDGEDRRPGVEAALRRLVAAKLNLDTDQVDPSVGYFELGVASSQLLEIVSELEGLFDQSLSPTLLFEFPTIETLATHLVEGGAALSEPAHHRRKSAPSTDDLGSAPLRTGGGLPADIAIVGMSGRFPMAGDIRAFWRNLKAGRDCVREVPEDRWDWRDYGDMRSPTGKPLSRWGGFIEDVDCFDAQFFRVSPAEVEVVDPQERLFLQTSWEAIEDAGYTPETLTRSKGRRVGVFAGVMHKDYVLLANEAQNAGLPVIALQCNASIANRVSYFCNFRGPSMAVDTVCSSSLVAVHLAMQSLQLGECEVAVAGGVNLSLHPAKYLAYGIMDMHASDGRCRSFGAGGDGYVSSEAVGAVVLKPLRDAVADRDHIYAIIKASTTNHVGSVSGMTVPSPVAQAELIRSCLDRAGIDARTVGYVEAHGTGTTLGDPIELEGLGKAFRETTSDSQFCAIGSVKSNMGHAEAAAGICGLIKVALQLRHATLAPSLHAETPNPYIDWRASPFYVQRELSSWPRMRAEGGGESPRRAALSSFGATGSNAHLILEEYTAPQAGDAGGPPGERDWVVPVSARDDDRLRAYAIRLLAMLEDAAAEPGVTLEDLAYTLQVGRRPLRARVAFVVNDLQGLKDKLRAFGDGARDFPDVHHGRADGAARARAPAAAATDIATAWIAGAPIDWETLRGGRGRRISLPTYPFAKDRYWLSAGRARPRTPRAPAGPRGASDPALLLFERTWRDAPLPSGTAAQPSDRLVIMTASAARGRRLARAVEVLRSDPIENPRQYLVDVFEHIQTRLRGGLRQPLLTQIVIPDGDRADLATSVAGLLKTATLENPKFRGQVVVVDADTESEHLDRILEEEAAQPAASSEIWRTNKTRREVYWRAAPPRDTERADAPWRDRGVYLITGGAGGLGLLFAAEIVERVHDARIYLVNRLAPNGEASATIAGLQRNGARVSVVRADVTDPDSVDDLVASILREEGALHGVIHAAGLIKDGYLIKKTEAQFQAVLAPKVDGTINLDRATAGVALDFLVLFSSMAGAFGGVGQSDYAAANAFMDRFALQRTALTTAGRRRGRTLSIAWPLWRFGGMQMDDASLQEMRGHGFEPLPTEIGLQAFCCAYASPRPSALVLYGNHAAIEAATGAKVALDVAGPPAGAPGLPAEDAHGLEQRVLGRLARVLSEITHSSLEAIDPAEPLETYGIDSMMVVRLNSRLAEDVKDLPKTLFFEHQTLRAIASYIAAAHTEQAVSWTADRTDAAPAAKLGHVPDPGASPPPIVTGGRGVSIAAARRGRGDDKDIAIIGVAGRYPQAPDLDTFWRNLRAGRNCVGEIPPERWKLDGFYEADVERAVASGKSYSRRGGFLDGFDEFDPLFFNISPVEAAGIDPQERLFLQTCWELIENAGYTRAVLAERHGGRVGVFAGVTKTGFELHGPALWERGQRVLPHTSFSSVANRVSYFFDLHGPSMPIDTMCSASLTAIHQACEHLIRGECEVAIAGGVNLYLHPANYVGLSAMRMLSKSDACRSFGADGDGFVPGEGVGAVLLKPLHFAIRDRDRIHATIKASAINHGGKTNGYTVPNPVAQRDLILAALDRADLSASTISYVEAHGTGTLLGDPIEIAALTQAFRQSTQDRGYCAIGSVKSNIGHLESAAGIAGLTKVLLQLRHRTLVASLHAEATNPNIDFANSPFQVQRTVAPWARPTARSGGRETEAPRTATVSSFGAGGSNAFVVVQEFMGDE